MIGDRHRRWLSGALGLVVVATVVARAATLLVVDPWFDELYSLYAASGQPGDAWAAAVADRVHPPGFYLVLWGWLHLVDPSPLGLRLLPFLGWLAMLGGFGWLGQRAGPDRPRTLALVALAAVNPVLFEFGAFVRGYSLLLAVVTLAMGLAIGRRPDHDRGLPWPLLLALVVATWLHYFAWPVVGAVVLGLAWQRRWRDAVLCTAVPLAGFVPWVLAIARSDAEVAAVGASLDFITRPGLVELLTAPGTLLADPVALPVAAILAIVSWEALVRWRLRGGDPSVVLAVALPLLAAFVATTLTPIGAWGLRYLAVALPALLLALVASTLAAPRIGSIYLGFILAFGAIGIVAPRTRHTPWHAVLERIGEGGNTIAYANEGFVLLPLRYQALTRQSPVTVTEVRGMPPAEAPPGWIVLRPAMLPAGYQPADALKSTGRTVSDSFAMGEGWLEVRGWRFQ